MIIKYTIKISKGHKMSQSRDSVQQIELLQNNRVTVLGPKNKYRNDVQLVQLKQSIKQRIVKILQYNQYRRDKQQKTFKLAGLFYVDPFARSTGFWDLFIILIIYILQLQISLTLGFGDDFWQNQLKFASIRILYVFLILMLVVDILINLHKGYYAFGRGKIIDDPQLIFKHYMKLYFPIDAICLGILMVPIFKNYQALNYLQLIPTVLLYVKKFKCQREIVDMLQYNKRLRIFFILLMLAIDLLMVGHFGACLFVGMDLLLWRLQYYGNDPQFYWLSSNSMYPVDLMNGPWYVQYIYAQSFSTGTLSTIAPGPFAKNPIQTVYSIFIMILFMLLASYAAQVIVSILISQSQIRTFHEANIQKFDKYMKLKGVKGEMSRKIHSFFQLIWEMQVKTNIEEQLTVINKLPMTIREQLVIQMQFVKNLQIFNNLSNAPLLIRILSMKVTKNIIDNQRNLFKSCTVTEDHERFVYFFKDGIAKFYLQSIKSEFTIGLTNLQRTVGQYQFITGLAYNYSCRSIDLCILSKISFIDFREAVVANGMKEQYDQLKYRLLIQEQLQLIEKKCLICEENHSESKCPLNNSSILIKDQLKRGNRFSKEMKRKNHTRRNLKSTKVNCIHPKAVAKAHIVMMFLAYKGLSELFMKIKIVDNAEVHAIHDKFFPSFNIDESGQILI